MNIEIADLNQKDQHFEAVKIIIEYSETLGLDLCFQNFEEEISDLTKLYSPNKGQALFLKNGEEIAGFVAIKKIDEGICEMKRLYIKPQFRRQGWAKKMTEKIIEISQGMGYKAIRLDTLIRLEPAVNLYKNLGFKEIEPYYFNPIKEVVFMEKDLKNG